MRKQFLVTLDVKTTADLDKIADEMRCAIEIASEDGQHLRSVNAIDAIEIVGAPTC